MTLEFTRIRLLSVLRSRLRVRVSFPIIRRNYYDSPTEFLGPIPQRMINPLRSRLDYCSLGRPLSIFFKENAEGDSDEE